MSLTTTTAPATDTITDTTVAPTSGTSTVSSAGHAGDQPERPETTPAATVDLATRIQRRRDFTAHATGFAIGALVLVMLTAFDPAIGRGQLTMTTVIMWATALSFQHFRHVIRGPVTLDHVVDEAVRLKLTTNGPALGANPQRPA